MKGEKKGKKQTIVKSTRERMSSLDPLAFNELPPLKLMISLSASPCPFLLYIGSDSKIGLCIFNFSIGF